MPSKTVTSTAPITENEYVKEFLDILKKHQSPSVNDFNAILNHIVAMERQLDKAVKELKAMRYNLAETEKHKHPIKSTMQSALISMQAQILELKEKLKVLKQTVIDGCKNALITFKEKGISALDDITRFIKIKSMLEVIQTGADKAIQSADRAVSNIEAASKRYHEAELHLKNAGRALSGKEARQKAKPPGRIAKIFSAPFRATRFCFNGIRNNAVTAVDKVKRLEEREAERKPSIKKTMKKLSKEIKQVELDAPDRSHITKIER